MSESSSPPLSFSSSSLSSFPSVVLHCSLDSPCSRYSPCSPLSCSSATYDDGSLDDSFTRDLINREAGDHHVRIAKAARLEQTQYTYNNNNNNNQTHEIQTNTDTDTDTDTKNNTTIITTNNNNNNNNTPMIPSIITCSSQLYSRRRGV